MNAQRPAVEREDPGTFLSVDPVPAGGCPAEEPASDARHGAEHSAVLLGNETWTAEASPHRVPHGLRIADGASLTLVPCATVLLPADGALVVGDGGALFAMGDRGRRVRIGAIDRSRGMGGVHVEAGARPSTRLRRTLIEHGAPSSPCLLDALHAVDLDTVTVLECPGGGIVFSGDGTALVLDGS